jgi:hypothetical protein
MRMRVLRLLSVFLLVFAASTSCTREVRINVPTAPVPCVVPAFHEQVECADDVACLLTEFALTVQAEQAVADALSVCPSVEVSRGL